MSQIPLYFIAQQISTMVITPQTAAADGTLSDGSPTDVKAAAIFEDMEYQGSRGNTEISPADSLIENYQQTKDSFVLRLTTIDKAGKAQPLLDIYGANNWLKLVGQATPPGGSALKTFTIYGVIDSVVTSWRAGKNATTIIVRPVGIKPTWA